LTCGKQHLDKRAKTIEATQQGHGKSGWRAATAARLKAIRQACGMISCFLTCSVVVGASRPQVHLSISGSMFQIPMPHG
jgi:hypothetical protein